MRDRIPTERQYRFLRVLGDVGLTVVVPTRGNFGGLLRWGWVEDAGWEPPATPRDRQFLPPLRITPHGLRALALGLEQYGHPKGGAS